MVKRTAFEAGRDKRRALKAAEDAGEIADSMDVRRALIARVHAGEITLAQAQDELKKIKAGAERDGKVTREQAFNAG